MTVRDPFTAMTLYEADDNWADLEDCLTEAEQDCITPGASKAVIRVFEDWLAAADTVSITVNDYHDPENILLRVYLQAPEALYYAVFDAPLRDVILGAVSDPRHLEDAAKLPGLLRQLADEADAIIGKGE